MISFSVETLITRIIKVCVYKNQFGSEKTTNKLLNKLLNKTRKQKLKNASKSVGSHRLYLISVFQHGSSNPVRESSQKIVFLY